MKQMRAHAFQVLLILFLTVFTFPLEKTPYERVNPFIGTREMGHTFPGAVVPFGMVQLSPDTESPPYWKDGAYNPEVYRYCAGYQYNDTTLLGFSHTHFNGTGHSDLGDFLLMPTMGRLLLEPGTAENPETGYRSRFSHSTERAAPGYYRVRLDDYGIDAELTATARVGFHKYTFNQDGEAHLILDLIHSLYQYDGKVIWSSVRVENGTLITGYRQTRGWGRERRLCFAMAFSKPFKRYGQSNDENLPYQGFWHRALNQEKNSPLMAGRNLRAYFDFDVKEGETILVKTALSAVDTEGALKNLEKEIPHWDFEWTRSEARKLWESELDRVRIESSPEKAEIFYTALYHTLQNPHVYMDVDGRYRGLDQNIHTADGFTNYTLFSLWDTFRAQHPWLTLIHPSRTRDMIESMLTHYEQSAHKLLPIWSFHANETWCMIGYHAVPVIADAYVKGIRGFDPQKALRAMTDSAAHAAYSGLGNYMKYGYVPSDLEFGENGASKTLEYAYDDWSLAVFAEALGEKKAASEFYARAANFRNLFDPLSGFIRARNADGSWLEPFDPMKTTGMGYIEGNAWNYTLFVPHDIEGLIRLTGGRKSFIKRLDNLFTQAMSKEAYAESEDIAGAGMIGGYVHGNEPGHHIPYLFNYAGAPWKTQKIVRCVMDNMYSTQPGGIPGNDDTGQMSAWFVFGALGFYPVCPGTDQYVIGSPSLAGASIRLENGKTFHMKAEGLTPGNVYIQSVKWNGIPLKQSYITHQQILSGGTLLFEMGPVPNRSWAAKAPSFPYSRSANRRLE